MLVTQNIDDLHERADQKNITHAWFFGKFIVCIANTVKSLTLNYLPQKCKNCKNVGMVRIDVVWFGEQPKYLDKIYSFLENSTEVFISIGTSNNVYPAAGFIDFLLQTGKKIIFYEFNIETTNKSSLFDKNFIGPASKTVPGFVDRIIKSK